VLKRIVLTDHARTRLDERKIRFEWVERTVRAPEWTEPDRSQPGVERRFRAVPEFGGRMLRVACVETENTIRVVTLTFDRDARRKR
jgi:hypothetical protein